MPFLKHRNELEFYAFEFAARLGAGETLTTPQVTVSLRTGSSPPYQDKTSEFVTGSPSISSSKALFTLRAASVGEQAEGADYTVYCKVNTNSGRILVSTTSLRVTDEARTT